ncbi:MAG: pyridoxal 5'-phosphate synthase glutaminase subunit PdxT [Oscillospiraceae bacterium]|nr:pyridoxal 5'-phosphate synthase glutaminase subunit PdxT [Oscillospiraceae bacterium]
MTIAVLALQGAFKEHIDKLNELNIESFEIRQAADLTRHFDGLILPGGESTVQGKLLRELGIFEDLQKKIQEGLPVYGTCAGLLLLAKDIENDSRRHLALMDITANRNAYGRQLGSFYIESDFKGIGKIPMTFIRAPYIERVGESVEILAEVDGKIVAAREKNMLVTAFHPELSGNFLGGYSGTKEQNLAVHKYFSDMISL